MWGHAGPFAVEPILITSEQLAAHLALPARAVPLVNGLYSVVGGEPQAVTGLERNPACHRSRNSPGVARGVVLLGRACWCRVGGPWPLAGSVAGSVDEQGVAGVDESVE